MTDEINRDFEVEKAVNIIAAALPSTYLMSDSLVVTALAAAVMIVVLVRGRN